MGIEQQIKDALQGVVDSHGGNFSKAAEALGVGVQTLWGWMKERRGSKGRTALWQALDAAGVSVVQNGVQQELGKDVCWIDPKVVPAGEGQPPPKQEDYLAVPLVEEVGAGPGIIPQGKLLSWFLVWRYQQPVMHKRDLIAVMIGEHSTSMLPTLRPKDIVLVDRQDLDCSRPGRIMLVIDPDGSGMIKRVSSRRILEEADWQITFYSDNTVQNPPEVFSLQRDYGGDWTKAIGGHVVWAWSDMDGR